MLARDDEQMAARRRVDVHEGDGALVLAHARGRDLAGHDLAEQAVGVLHGATVTSLPRACRRPRPPARRPSSTCRRSSARPPRAGERAAADWIRDALRGARRAGADRGGAGHRLVRGAGRRCSRAGAAAGLAPRRAGAAAAAGLAAAAAIADDVSGGPHWFRRLLPRRTTHNVVAETGDPDGAETVVFVAHHDAARAGWSSTPGRPAGSPTFPGWYARQETSPPLMQLVVAGPALARARRAARPSPAAARRRRTALARRRSPWRHRRAPVVPGRERQPRRGRRAARARAAAARRAAAPACACCCSRPAARSRSWRGCAASSPATPARCPASARASSCSSASAGPEPILLEGEGMLRMHDYTPAVRDWLAACAERAGAPPAARAAHRASPPTR